MKQSLTKAWAGMTGAAAMFLFAASAHATVVATNTTYGIFNDDPYGTRPLTVTTHGTIQDVNITIDFAKCDTPGTNSSGACAGLGNSFNNEIIFRLVSPNGDVVSLVEEGTYTNGTRPGIGRIQVTFDDEAAAPVGPVLAPGTYRPVTPLSAFDGLDMYGTWNLYIENTDYGDPLEFFGASLDITYTACGGGGTPPGEVPEPASLAIVGLGLAGMAALRRRKHS
jgi:hypothetical protein